MIKYCFSLQNTLTEIKLSPAVFSIILYRYSRVCINGNTFRALSFVETRIQFLFNLTPVFLEQLADFTES